MVVFQMNMDDYPHLYLSEDWESSYHGPAPPGVSSSALGHTHPPRLRWADPRVPLSPDLGPWPEHL
jgi:hypothetical protein